MHGLIESTARSFKRSSKPKHKPQIRHGQRRAVLRAVTGAKVLLGLPIEAASLAEAAKLVGSNIRYVEAAAWLLQTNDPELLADVVVDRKPLLATAAKARRRTNLINAYREAAPEDRAALGAAVGVGRVWDETIVPAL